MVRRFALGFLASILIVYQVRALELLANYKYWKSTSDQLIYDYSGNSRHGGLHGNFIFTNRGFAPYDYYVPNLMRYAFPTITEYTISFWLLNHIETSSFNFLIYHNSGNFGFESYISNNPTFTLQFYNNGTFQFSKSISSFQGWNLHTVTISIDSSVPSRVNIYLYINLAYIDSTSIDTGAVNISIHDIHMGNSDANTNKGLILYEMWVHTLLNISELNSLFSSSSSCGCTYNCPTSPTTVCLSSSGKYQNQAGTDCPTSCTSNFQSCEASLNCIPKSKGECKYGIYDVASSECLFFCQDNSCNCSTVTDATTSIKTFICSCASGYMNISSDPPACISIRCLTYHKVGYKYICDTTEAGYILYNTEDCCICDTAYTLVSSSPIVCMNIPYCLGYVLYGVNYICSSCATGYRVDPNGNCKLCVTNYVVVQNSPFTCALEILNCINYIQVGTSWKCQSCIQGYKVDTNQLCNECDVGYFAPSTNPFICALQILNCINYIKVGTSWKCQSCIQGYKVDTNQECNQCDVGYFVSSTSPFTCALEILNCINYDYIISAGDYKCSRCEVSYQLDSEEKCNLCNYGFVKVLNNPFTCIRSIKNCKDHKFNGDIWVCNECNEEYSLDSAGNCNQCNIGSVKVLDSPLTCIRGIENCKDYKFNGDIWVCNECNEEYSLDSAGNCNQCNIGSVKVLDSPLKCIRSIRNCKDYKFAGDSWVCNECNEEYLLDSAGNCNQCSPGYINALSAPFLCAPEIEHCSTYIHAGDQWICTACDLGYSIDINGTCYKCSLNYINILLDPFTCILNIDHCFKYQSIYSTWVCEECEEGYTKSSLGTCDNCAAGYINISTDYPICRPEISNCIIYDLLSNDSCLVCKEGFNLDSSFTICFKEIVNCILYEEISNDMICKDCEDGYILLDNYCYDEIDHCSEYDIYHDEAYCVGCNAEFILDCDNCYHAKKCRKCPDKCIICKSQDNSTKCLECDEGFEVVNNECKVNDSSDYYNTTDISVSQGTMATQMAIVSSISVSMISLNLNSVLSMIGTIQILSYILLYNLHIPSRIRVILEGISFLNIFPNIFEYFIISEDTLDIERYRRADINNELFFINSGKTLTMLITIILVIMILKILKKLSQKLNDTSIFKRVITRLLESLEWSFVVGYLIQASLELTITSLINIYHVSFYNTKSVIGFSISILVLVRNNSDPFIRVSCLSISIFTQKL